MENVILEFPDLEDVLSPQNQAGKTRRQTINIEVDEESNRVLSSFEDRDQDGDNYGSAGGGSGNKPNSSGAGRLQFNMTQKIGDHLYRRATSNAMAALAVVSPIKPKV
jgi:hypothetical protein